MKKFIVLVLVVSSMFVFAGCNQEKKVNNPNLNQFLNALATLLPTETSEPEVLSTDIPQETPGNVDNSTAEPTVTSDPNLPSIQWPSQIPAEVLVMKNVKFTASYNQIDSFTVSFSDADTAKVNAYIAEMKVAGFVEQGNLNTPDGIFTGLKNANYTVSISFVVKEGSGIITISKNQ